jgi:hypothetical protein
MNLQ